MVEFGRRLAVSPFRVPDEVYGRVAAHFDDAQMTALTAFGAIMVATNVFNNALEVELDEYLQPYRRAAGRGAVMPGEFAGKVAFVTGAAHGQGRARRSPWRGRARGSRRSTSPGPSAIRATTWARATT